MKKAISFVSICFFVSISVFGQSQRFIDAMSKTIKEFDTAKTSDQLIAVGNKFERIALAEKNQWLPYYYSALSRTFSRYMVEDHSTSDEILDVAQRHIDIADSLSPNNSDIILVKGMILTARILVNPMVRGMMYGPQSGALVKQAMDLDPENPRPYLISGEGYYYTPPQFGGDKAKACELFTTAKTKFGTFKPAMAISPNWGEEENAKLLANCGG